MSDFKTSQKVVSLNLKKNDIFISELLEYKIIFSHS